MDILNQFSSLFVDYYKAYDKYKKLYGENIIVLHQTGHFYEIYDYYYNNNFLCSDIYKVSNIVNLSVTRRDKNKELSPKNWLMSGVPLVKLDKYCDIFLQNNYHVIVISQISAPPNPEREVTHILSPGTTLSEFNHTNVEKMLPDGVAAGYYKDEAEGIKRQLQKEEYGVQDMPGEAEAARIRELELMISRDQEVPAGMIKSVAEHIYKIETDAYPETVRGDLNKTKTYIKPNHIAGVKRDDNGDVVEIVLDSAYDKTYSPNQIYFDAQTGELFKKNKQTR